MQSYKINHQIQEKVPLVATVSLKWYQLKDRINVEI